MAPDQAATLVQEWLAAQPDLDAERAGERSWLAVLAGERKRTIPVYLEVGEHTLAVESFFMRAPDENQAEVYRRLLERNMRTYVLRFALGPGGDVMLVGLLPLHALTAEELDRLMGQLLEAADGAFDEALRAGFASYIEREQAWRERVGAGRNPIT